MKPIIEVNNLSKVYRLGNLGAKSFTDDLRYFWEKIRGKEQPLDPKVLDQVQSEGESGRINPERKNEFWALRDISFKIQPGEVVGIIGRNGAGKSTLLKILSRITEPTTGEITLRGRVSSLLEVGTGFHPDLTGRENTYLNGAIHGMTRKEIDEKFEEIVEFAKVTNFIDTPVKRYSSGMFVRLAFAVAAHLEPEILIVDEVLAVGDAAFQSKCLSKMKDIAKQGKTVIFVSHIMTSVKSLCSRCILLHQGAIIESGETSEIIEKYLSFGQDMGERETLNPDSFTYNTGEAQFDQIELLDIKSQKQNRFLYRDPIKFSLSVTVCEVIEDLIVSVYFITRDGTPISFGCSVDIPEQKFSVSPGNYLIEIESDAKLLPGNYSVKAALAHPNGDAICLIERFFDFQVERLANDHRVNYQWTRSNAFSMMPTKWGLKRL